MIALKVLITCKVYSEFYNRVHNLNTSTAVSDMSKSEVRLPSAPPVQFIDPHFLY